MRILGIDPAPRHTGYYLKGTDPLYTEKGEWRGPELEPLLESGKRLFTLLSIFLTDKTPDVVVMERQHASASAMTFYVQMELLRALDRYWAETQRPPRMLHPFPTQLKSYISQRTGKKIPRDRKGPIVDAYKEETKDKNRVSSHTAEAYFLAQMGADTLDGKFKLTLPEKEFPLTQWGTNTWQTPK